MKRNYFWLVGPWLVFLAAACGWIAYWHIAAATAEQRINAFLTQQQAQGASASIGRIVRHGFPAMLRLELQDIAYAPARGGWRAETERVDLHLNLVNTDHISAEAEAPIAVARANGAVTNITADALIGSLRTEGGRLAVAGVEADNLVLDDPAEDGVLRVRKVVLNVRPDARVAGEYQLAFDATALTLPREVRSFETFGLEVPMLRAAIVIEQGRALVQSAEGDPLGPWRDAGGKLRFEALQLNWGPLQTTGTGEGALDAQRRLSGRLVLPIEQPAPVLNAIADAPRVNEDARQALRLLAAGYLVSGNDITFDITAHEGVLRIEGLPVRPLPPVY